MKTLTDKQIPVLLELIAAKHFRVMETGRQIQKLNDELDYHQKALDMEIANLKHLVDPGCYLVELPVGSTFILIAPADGSISFYPVDFWVTTEEK